MTRTTKSLLPVKRYFASATAARKATTIESATTAPTTIRLFLTVSQKYGTRDRVAEVLERRIASRTRSARSC